METDNVTIKNSSFPTEISFDSWKIVIEYLNDDNIHSSGFKKILLYQLISKTFSNIILVLKCNREV
jgi:hypothetical protein